MELKYEFKMGEITFYDISWSELTEALEDIFADTYKISKSVAVDIINDLNLVENDDVREYFKEDIENYFYEKAKEYHKNCEAQSKEESHMQYWERI